MSIFDAAWGTHACRGAYGLSFFGFPLLLKKDLLNKELKTVTVLERFKFQLFIRKSAANVRESAANVRLPAVEVRGALQLKYEGIRVFGALVTEASITGLGDT